MNHFFPKKILLVTNEDFLTNNCKTIQIFNVQKENSNLIYLITSKLYKILLSLLTLNIAYLIIERHKLTKSLLKFKSRMKYIKLNKPVNYPILR